MKLCTFMVYIRYLHTKRVGLSKHFFGRDGGQRDPPEGGDAGATRQSTRALLQALGIPDAPRGRLVRALELQVAHVRTCVQRDDVSVGFHIRCQGRQHSLRSRQRDPGRPGSALLLHDLHTHPHTHAPQSTPTSTMACWLHRKGMVQSRDHRGEDRPAGTDLGTPQYESPPASNSRSRPHSSNPLTRPCQ